MEVRFQKSNWIDNEHVEVYHKTRTIGKSQHLKSINFLEASMLIKSDRPSNVRLRLCTYFLHNEYKHLHKNRNNGFTKYSNIFILVHVCIILIY